MLPHLTELIKAIEVILPSAIEETDEVWLWFNEDESWDVDQYDNTSFAINCVYRDLVGATASEIAEELLGDLQIELAATIEQEL